MMFVPRLLHIVFLLSIASAKIYDRCELARELKNIHEIPESQIATWVCIAKHESNFNTSATNHGSGDHGLFQISQLFWCSPPGDGFGCNAPCSSFKDDNIADDVSCIRRIYNEHKRLSGDGFNAWVVYPLYCKGDVTKYVEGCHEQGIIDNNITEKPTSTTIKIEEEDDDGYDFPPLPSRPPTKKKTTSTDDGYEFPPLPVRNGRIQSTTDGKIQNKGLVEDIVGNAFFNYLFQITTTKKPFLSSLLTQISQIRPPSIGSLNPFGRQISTPPPFGTKLFTNKPTYKTVSFNQISRGSVVPIKSTTPNGFPGDKKRYLLNNYSVTRSAGGFSTIKKS